MPEYAIVPVRATKFAEVETGLKVRRRGRGEYDVYIGESLGRGLGQNHVVMDVKSYDDGIIDDDEFVFTFFILTHQNMKVLVWTRWTTC